MKRSRLRSYAPVPARSAKVEAGADAFAAVYREVDERSEGRCEVEYDSVRCPRRAVEHHHLFKPRRANHTAAVVVHVCAACHDRMEWPYQRGRLVYTGSITRPWETRFLFALRYASDKFSARREG